MPFLITSKSQAMRRRPFRNGRPWKFNHDHPLAQGVLCAVCLDATYPVDAVSGIECDLFAGDAGQQVSEYSSQPYVTIASAGDLYGYQEGTYRFWMDPWANNSRDTPPGCNVNHIFGNSITDATAGISISYRVSSRLWGSSFRRFGGFGGDVFGYTSSVFRYRDTVTNYDLSFSPVLSAAPFINLTCVYDAELDKLVAFEDGVQTAISASPIGANGLMRYSASGYSAIGPAHNSHPYGGYSYHRSGSAFLYSIAWNRALKVDDAKALDNGGWRELFYEDTLRTYSFPGGAVAPATYTPAMII